MTPPIGWADTPGATDVDQAHALAAVSIIRKLVEYGAFSRDAAGRPTVGGIDLDSDAFYLDDAEDDLVGRLVDEHAAHDFEPGQRVRVRPNGAPLYRGRKGTVRPPGAISAGLVSVLMDDLGGVAHPHGMVCHHRFLEHVDDDR
jgi:hypothetical protein